MDKKMRIFGLLILGLFLLPILSSFVVAQAPSSSGSAVPIASVTSVSDIFDPVKDMFINWEKGQLSVNIAKYLFFILLALIVYSIVGFIPMFRSLGIKIPLSIIVAFLATAYLAPSDIYTALASYGSLGLVLGAALPFIILLFFSIQINQIRGAGGRILSKALWGAFILFLIWKLVFGMFFCTLANGRKCISLWEGWVYIGFIVACLIYLLAERKLLAALFKEEIRAEGEVISRALTKDKLRAMERELEHLGEDWNIEFKRDKPDQKKLEELERRIKALQKALGRAS